MLVEPNVSASAPELVSILLRKSQLEPAGGRKRKAGKKSVKFRRKKCIEPRRRVTRGRILSRRAQVHTILFGRCFPRLHFSPAPLGEWLIDNPEDAAPPRRTRFAPRNPALDRLEPCGSSSSRRKAPEVGTCKLIPCVRT